MVALLLGPFGTTSWAQAVKTPDAVSLHGAGSTFAAPLYKKWIEEYAVSHPNVSISYDVVGSGEGVKRFLADAVDFAGSDEILSDSETAKAGGAIMIPITAGMIAIAYNIPGVNAEIKLPRETSMSISSPARSGNGTIRASRPPTRHSRFHTATSRLSRARTAAVPPRRSPIIWPRSVLRGSQAEWALES